MPTNIPTNVAGGGDTNDEYDRRENIYPFLNSPIPRSSHGHMPHAYTALDFSNTFAGTSSGNGHYKELFQELCSRRSYDNERDSLFYAMYQQQQEMMSYM